MSTAVRLTNLQFRWNIYQPMVIDIPEFHVEVGESLFIKGPSGSGKSTLLNLIGGVLNPVEGDINVLGQDFNELSPKQKDRLRGDQMGFIFQQFNLIPYLSVLENIQLPLAFSEERKQRPHDVNEVQRLMRLLKLDVDRILKRPVTELSVGQQQRVAAVRALIGDPALIIADEPTSSLDADAKDSFVKTLFEEVKRRKSTLIFVSHDASLSHYFSRSIDLTKINRAYAPAFTGDL